ncbi:MAG: biotin-dependent carboxyltransferase family protein [Hyphomicrobiaceae bacterium]
MSNAALRVVQPGLHTTVQDLGRIGAQHLGIPVAGALDPIALRSGNVVVGNAQGTAGLEIAVMGPVLEIEAESVRVAVSGLGSRLAIEAADGTTREIPPLQSVRLVCGDRVRVAAAAGSSVAYLAIEGGLALPPFMGSLATYVRGGFGGFEGRALAAGDRIPLVNDTVEARAEMRLTGIDLAPATEVRVILGPQDDYFTSEAVERFLLAPYTVSREADRMGLRLEGEALEHSKGYNIVSDGIAPGSIQVPGSRLPIILLADRQTAGGYPKIATVISADIAATGRLLPGSTFRFRAISLAEAQASRRRLEDDMANLAARLSTVRPDGPDLERLYDSNLVSGVVDAESPHFALTSSAEGG